MNKFYFSCLLFALILISCNKDNGTKDSISTHLPIDRVQIYQGLLKFESDDHVSEVMRDLIEKKISQNNIQERFPEFVSLAAKLKVLSNEMIENDFQNGSFNKYANIYNVYEDENGDKFNVEVLSEKSPFSNILNENAQMIVGAEQVQFTFKEILKSKFDGEVKGNLVKEADIQRSTYKEVRKTSDTQTSRAQCIELYKSNTRRMTGNYADYYAFGIKTFESSTKNWKKNCCGGWRYNNTDELELRNYWYIRCTDNPSYLSYNTWYDIAYDDDRVEYSLSFYVPSIPNCNGLYMGSGSIIEYEILNGCCLSVDCDLTW